MMTLHRREVIDDHMNDSNWKKLVDLGRLLTGTTSELTEIHVANAISKCYCEEPTDGSFGGTGRGLKATNSR